MHKIYPNPTGKMGFHLNMLYDQDINCKKLSYEVVTRSDSTCGIKRKRAEAIVISDDESDGGKKEVGEKIEGEKEAKKE